MSPPTFQERKPWAQSCEGLEQEITGSRFHQKKKKMQTAFVHVVNLLNGTLAQSQGLMRGIGVKERQCSRRAASVNPRNAGPDITDVVSPTCYLHGSNWQLCPVGIPQRAKEAQPVFVSEQKDVSYETKF